MFRRILVTLTSLALVVSTLSVAPTAHAGGVVTSTASLPFAGSIFDSVTGEFVDISGHYNIVTQVTISTTGDTLTVHAALPADVVATGRTSGNRYIVNGTTILQLSFPPGSFIPPPSTSPTPYGLVEYALILALISILVIVAGPSPTGQPHPTDTLYSSLTLKFAGDGTLLADRSSVRLCGDQIGSCQNTY
jgi:Flp pilus assembly pilin Flp